MHQRASCSSVPQKADDEIKNLRVEDGRSLKIFSCSRCSGEHENSRTDDRANAQTHQRPWAQSLL